MAKGPTFKKDAGGNIHYAANDEDPLCDFCADPDETCVAALLVKTRDLGPTRAIDDAGRRVGPVWNRMSYGEWYCCGPCLGFIVAHDREALAARHVAYSLSTTPHVRLTHRLMMELTAETLHIHGAALNQLEGWPS